MLDGPVIRSEAEGDAPAIRAVHTRAFPTGAEARLVDALRASGRLRVSLVAIVEGEIVGHIAMSPVRVGDELVGLGLAPLAVAPAHQQRGIGARLVRASLLECRAAGAGLVVVLGDPKYYSRFGFAPASEIGLRDEYGGGDAFRALALDAAHPPPRGLVRYAPEFAQLGGLDGSL